MQPAAPLPRSSVTPACLFPWQVNSDYDSTFVFDNDFPALQPGAPDPGELGSSSLTQQKIFEQQCSADFQHAPFFNDMVSMATVNGTNYDSFSNVFYSLLFELFALFFRSGSTSVVPVQSCSWRLVRSKSVRDLHSCRRCPLVAIATADLSGSEGYQ